MKPDLTRPVDFTTYNGTDKICTRSGLPWRGLGKVKNSNFPNAGSILDISGDELTSSWSNNGLERLANSKYVSSFVDQDCWSLFYALPEKVEKTFWIVVSEEEINSNRIECILYPNREKIGSISISSQIVPITLLVEE